MSAARPSAGSGSSMAGMWMPPEASAFVLLSAGGASGRWEMFAEGRICTARAMITQAASAEAR